MDTVVETPLKNAEQILAEKTGGVPADQIGITRKAVAENLGTPIGEVTPNAEIADAEIGNFLNKVVHVQEKGESAQVGASDSVSNSGLSELGQNFRALSPVGGSDEELVREMSSLEANKYELERQEKMKAK